MPSSIEHALATVDALVRVIDTYPSRDHSPVAVVRQGLLNDAHAALLFALDEIEQTRADRNDAIRIALDLALRLVELEDVK